MNVQLAFGKTGLPAEIPDGNLMKVLTLRTVEPLPDLEEKLASALRHPIGCQDLRTIAAGKRRAVIVISDITRPVPNTTILPPILSALRDAG